MHSLFLREVLIDRDVVSDCMQHIATLHSLDQLTFQKQITPFTEENDSGKSTLLEAIAAAYGFNPEGGTKNYRFYTGDTHSSLHEGIHLGRGFCRPSYSYFLRVESFYNLATRAEEYASIYQRGELHSCSHGESFLSFIQSFRDIGLLLLGEPETALSSQRQLTLLIQLLATARGGSQFLITANSPVLLGTPNARILSSSDGIIEEIVYEQTTSYQITETFMNNHKYMLSRLSQENGK